MSFLDEFAAAFKESFIDEDEIIILHSGLWTFGHQWTGDPSDFADAILSCIREVLGPDRTLVMPAYNSGFFRSRVFDISKTKCDTGLLCQTMLDHPDSMRSPKPIDSYTAVGPKAGELLGLPAEIAWGEDGVMAYAYRHNARFIALGLPWAVTCSYMHYAEVVADVPYRYPKRFSGLLLNNGNVVGQCSEVLHVGPYNAPGNWQQYDELIAAMLGDSGTLKSSEDRFQITSGRMTGMMDRGIELLLNDPYACVPDRDSLKRWVEEEKDEEIANLPPENRV